MEENGVKERILVKAEEIFFHYGYTRVRMDEISDSLGISKKTLYKYFDGKEQLLREIVERMKLRIKTNCHIICDDQEMDFIHKLKKLMNYIAKQSSKLRGVLPEDLQKNHPDIWDGINEYRKKEAFTKFKDLIEEGVRKGAFRKDIDQQIIVLMYVNAISELVRPDVLVNLPYTGDQVFETIIKIMFEGIFTDEGRTKYLSSYNIDKKD
ncbi:MAG: TetR/AcrR family transcriptional regulator [Ignavibacteriaceae bacterium]